MRTVEVRFEGIEAIKRFVDIISRLDVDYDLVQGKYIVDAKSMMGVLGLNFDEEMSLNIHSDDLAALEAVKEYVL